MRVLLTKAQLTNTKWVASLGTRALKKDVASEVSSNDVLKAQLGRSLLDTSNARKRLGRDDMFHQLQYHSLMSR